MQNSIDLEHNRNIWGPGRVGAQSGLGPGPGWRPSGPLWAHIWAHMGPYGPIWVLLDRSGHDQITTFGPISHASVPKLSF